MISPLPFNSFSNVLRTVSNLGFKQSAKICICFLTPSAFSHFHPNNPFWEDFKYLNQYVTRVQSFLQDGTPDNDGSAILIRDSIRAALIPTVDSAKTVGLVSLPGMMSGLIFAGIDPVKAIKYQIMVTFMLLSTASLSTIIACYLTYRKFYNSRHQLVVTQLKKK